MPVLLAALTAAGTEVGTGVVVSNTPDELLADLIRSLAGAFDTELFVVKSFMTLFVMCLLCGLIGAMVVGNRMAFFSDRWRTARSRASRWATFRCSSPAVTGRRRRGSFRW